MHFSQRCDFGCLLSLFVLHRWLPLLLVGRIPLSGIWTGAAKRTKPGGVPRPGAPAIMTESEFEIRWDFTEAEYAAYEALRTRQQRAWTRSFWSSSAQVVFGVAISGLVSLLAVASGASNSQAGGIIAALAFAAFYAGLWTCESLVARNLFRFDSSAVAFGIRRGKPAPSLSGDRCCLTPSFPNLPLRALLLHLAFDLRGNAATHRAEFHRRA